MSYSLDIEIFEEVLNEFEEFNPEPNYNEDEDWYEDPGSFDFLNDPAPTPEELNDMYYYFNGYDDPIRMVDVPLNEDRYER